MATTAIGLDIGTFAVRAAEVAVGGQQPTLLRFGQVALPPGAVRDGEVVDPAAVSSAIRRLWSEGGFKGKQVVTGLANQRVIVRPAEVPGMSDAELESALRFEAQELIPIPVDDAILDFSVLERFTGSEGDARMRILLAAAQRDMVRTHLAALEGAGLTASTVDLIPLALMRALAGPSGPAPDGAAPAQAIVCIGGAVTNVVVHQAGAYRFSRMLLVGGDDVTEAVARELDVDLEAAEDLKRRASLGGADSLTVQATRVVSDRMIPIIDEVRNSLEYYLSQPDAVPVDRVVVTGGGSRMLGLIERLEHQLRLPVEAARVVDRVKVGKGALDASQLEVAEPLLAVPLGLALVAAPAPAGTRRISLMPGEVAAGRLERRKSMAAGAAVASVAALLALGGLARQAQVLSKQKAASGTEAQAANLQRQVNALDDVTQLESELASRQALMKGLLAKDVDWPGVVEGVAATMPADVVITGFTAGADGSLTFTGKGIDQTSTAHWIERLTALDTVTDVWVSSSSKGEGRGPITFNSTARLTPKANSDRINRYTGGQS